MRAFVLIALLLGTACSSTPEPVATTVQAPPVDTRPPLGGPPYPPGNVVRHNNPAPVGLAFTPYNLPLNSVLTDARRSGRPALLLFRADWCGYCKKLERETLPDAQVRTEASRFTSVAYDAEQPEGRALAQRYGVRGFPTLVLVDAAGNKVDSWAGYSEPHIYAAIIRQMGTKQ